MSELAPVRPPATADEPRGLTRPSFSVVIAAYSLERWPDLVDAVASVRAQDYPALEVIVAVDGNAELLARVREELAGVVAVENDHFPGAGGARNAGSAVARGDVLAFIDDDVRAAPEWLARQQAEFADPAVLGVGGQIAPRWLTARPRWFPVEYDWVVGCTYRGTPTAPAQVRNLIAANMSIRRDRFQALGGFRHGFGKVGTRSAPEETDFCIRAGQRWPAGVWRFVPDAAVQHNVPAARTTLRYFLRRCWLEGLGKAELAALVGSDGTSAELTYVTRTLPSGVARYVAQAVRARRPEPLLRAVFVGVGLTWTVAGYVVGTVRCRRAASASA